MNAFRRWPVVNLLRLYVAAALLVAALLSPLALSFIPVLLLAWYLFAWRWRIAPTIGLFTEFFMFFAIALLFSARVNPVFALLISLPLLFLIDERLQQVADRLAHREARHTRQPTILSVALLWIVVLVLGVALLLGSTALLLASVVVVACFAALIAVILRRLPAKAVQETWVHQRMVAGSEASVIVKLTPQTGVGGLLFVESPYEWVKVNPAGVSLKNNELAITVSISPPLAGPSTIHLRMQATDRWGLIRSTFHVEAIRLYVVPRATYAAWVARRYLAESKAGTLPLVANIAASKPTYGLRRGIEYYGSQLYQPGDSLKNIDWKHSVKYNELISKEFSEFHGRMAVMLVNLAVGDAEEADQLASKVIMTAMSLAHENIPTALAAYDENKVRLSTSALSPKELIVQALRLAEETVIVVNPVRYLEPPDVTRLRSHLRRLQLVEGEGARVLAQLLQLEYENLSHGARVSPATRAIAETFARVDKQSNLVIISHRNHDAEALAFSTYDLRRRGNAVIAV